MSKTTPITVFDPHKIYRATDEALTEIAPLATFNFWRCRGGGPTFTKVSRRVGYLGSDLNQFIDESRVVQTPPKKPRRPIGE